MICLVVVLAPADVGTTVAVRAGHQLAAEVFLVAGHLRAA